VKNEMKYSTRTMKYKTTGDGRRRLRLLFITNEDLALYKLAENSYFIATIS